MNGAQGRQSADGSVKEAQAIVSLIGRSFGMENLPLPYDGDRPALMSVDEAVGWVRDAEAISAPAKVELLAQLSRRNMSRSVIEEIAGSVVKPQSDLPPGGSAPPHRPGDPLARSDVLDELVSRVYASKPGEDPLGRKNAVLLPGDPFFASLVPELQTTSISVIPRCSETVQGVDGTPAVSLATVVESSHPLAALSSLIDPREWPNCPLQGVFFKSMDMVRPPNPPPPTLRAPDDGWAARLEEVVDFSFGLDPTRSSLVTTDLDFTYFEGPSAVGCTYDLGSSIDGQISVDRGYLLLEDLESLSIRRTTTLKQVHFTSRRQPGSDECPVWSLAQALIGSSCMSRPSHRSGGTP